MLASAALTLMLAIPRPLPERYMTFTMPNQVTDGSSCAGASPMLADSCNAHFMWRGPNYKFVSTLKIRGKGGVRYWFDMPLAPGSYTLYYYTSGVGFNPCMGTMAVQVPGRLSPTIIDLKADEP